MTKGLLDDVAWLKTNSQVRTDIQPGIISEVCGVQYSQFVEPENLTLKNDPFDVGGHTQMGRNC
ncbi:hypothetical protein [Bacillus solitudinis]|uniref:hypothetical protein n=1 Tax=Bacillus solitudinis TaxID=2014074 RepID=UPI000C233F9F|nr:hypothetical protein [Bacillus solitudinis]